MLFKKKAKHPEITDPEEIRIIFRQLVENARFVFPNFSDEKLPCRLLNDEEDSLFIALKTEDRERFGIRMNQQAAIRFFYECKEYYTSVAIMGAGRFEGTDALRLAYPRALRINDQYCLTQLHLIPRRDCTFTSTTNQFCSGKIINLGVKGIDLRSEEVQPIRELLAVDHEVMVGFELSDSLKISQKGRVAYINQFDEIFAGIEFVDLDKGLEEKIAEWMTNQSIEKKNRELDALRKKRKPKPKRSAAAPRENAGPVLAHDYRGTILKEGDPYILLLSRDEALIQRLGKCLMRKYGILISKGRFSNVTKIMSHYDPKMIIIHDTIGTVSGFDLVKTILGHADAEIAAVIMGSAEEEQERRIRAIDAGALDYLPIEPFKMLPVFKRVDEAMSLFTDGM